VTETIHIVGAGVAGLSCAVRLSGEGKRVVLYESARMAGGRCRSYYDSALDLTIDNGNHLLLSGNRAARDYAARIGAAEALFGPKECVFDFLDTRSGERWKLRPNASRIPWWIFVKDRGVSGAGPLDYLGVLGILRASRDATIGDAMRCSGNLYERLWGPVLLAALNTEPREASATLAAAVLRETLAAGGDACRPLVATHGLGAAFVEPALKTLAAKGAEVRFGARLREIAFDKGRASKLMFADDNVGLGENDRIVLATPPWAAAELIPDLIVPDDFRGIVNAHFKIAPPRGQPPLLGMVGSLSEWLFTFEDRLSITISGADRLMDESRESLAERIWVEVAAATGLATEIPQWQIVKERRATFAATPRQESRRPPAVTRWSNLFLAGDWTATELPATIEGAVRSGYKAAAHVLGADEPNATLF
jgi:squalene-associated FAD-dependent desaturase